MAEFDTREAAERRGRIMREAQRIRDYLTKEVINYNYEYTPESGEKEGAMREDIKKHLRIAAREIDRLLEQL